jgi:hypothetical protein
MQVIPILFVQAISKRMQGAVLETIDEYEIGGLQTRD